MQVIFLAAGMGLRLGPLTRTSAKAMIPVNGLPMIDHNLPHLLNHRRVNQIIVVGGFEHAVLREHLLNRYSIYGERLLILQNQEFRKGNFFSLKTAFPYLEESFLICNADHIFFENSWKDILEERYSCNIFCDFKRPIQEDEMKVKLNQHGHCIDMSKTLENFDAAYIGLTYVPKNQLENYRDCADRAFREIGENMVVENALRRFAQEGNSVEVLPFDQRWFEIDTREDLAKAESFLSQKNSEPISSLHQG